MDLLSLPVPYLSGSSDLYPHSGKIPDDTYRTPWIRGSVISTSKLFISGSVLDDLKAQNQPFTTLERFFVEFGEEVVLSSNPDSLKDFDQNQCFSPIKESSQNDPCLELFSKWTPDKRKPGAEEKDLFLPEHLIVVDTLSCFKKHLPTLKAKLSRLRTIPVPDPLLSSEGLVISADELFGYPSQCAAFERPPDVDTIAVLTGRCVEEEFLKESLTKKELLLSPEVVEVAQLDLKRRTTFSSLWDQIKVHPEVLDERCSVAQVLCETFPPSVKCETLSLDLLEGNRSEVNVNHGSIESEFEGHLLPSARIEIDFVLSPSLKSRLSHICLSTSDLQEEPVSPSALLFLPVKVRMNMERLVWKAEKHLGSVLHFLLTDPPIDEPTVDFRPLRDALRLFSLEPHGFIDAADQAELKFDLSQKLGSGGSDFTESIKCDFTPTCYKEAEEFTKLPPEDADVGLILPSPAKEARFLDGGKADPAEIQDQEQSLTLQENVSSAVVSYMGNTSDQRPPAHYDNLNTFGVVGKTEKRIPGFQFSLSPGWSDRESLRSTTRLPQKLERDLDPLSTFMILRSYQALPAAASPQSSAVSAADVTQEAEVQLALTHAETPNMKQVHTGVTESIKQKVTHQWTSQLISRPVGQPEVEDKRDSRVIQIQATESQRLAYRELLAFVQPCLKSAKESGLAIHMWGDFSSVGPDRTHFLLKQQERALCKTPADDTELLRDQEVLFKRAALIHVLATFKEMLLKCDLTTGLGYLLKAAETCAEESLQQLLRKLHIILYISRKNPEANPKVLKLQQLLAEWLHGRTPHNTEKVLVIVSVDSEESRTTIVSSLSQVTGATVISVCPSEDQKRLNGASVVSSVCHSDCAVVFEQHIGPDFPWSCFSLVVEFDHPGQSPWLTVCSEKNLGHWTFNLAASDSDPHAEEESSGLESCVPYVLFVTEELKCPLLLQTLETSFNITVLERSHHPTLQLLGGIHSYAVITVDETTAVIIQEQEELCQERASERIVMRLTALSLQYSCCWLILHCPSNKGARFPREAFDNLVLVYSSLVLFGMKSEDLDVKVLILSEVSEIAAFINQICFAALMSTDRNPLDYLSRDWLAVISSQEEDCLSKFPCVNPLVAQLMLSRARSLTWLLEAPLVQLQDLLPEVPHKILKLFTDTTSLYMGQSQTSSLPCKKLPSPLKSPWDIPGELERSNSSLDSEHLPVAPDNSFLLGGDASEDPFCVEDPDPGAFSFHLSGPFGSPAVGSSWSSSQLWEREDQASLWGAAGRGVDRLVGDRLRASLSHSHSKLDSTALGDILFFPNSTGTSRDLRFPQHSATHWNLNTPTAAIWNRDQRSGDNVQKDKVSAYNRSWCWRGQERKRSGGGAGLPEPALAPMKMGRLSFERVPGRSDGQTRLRLF